MSLGSYFSCKLTDGLGYMARRKARIASLILNKSASLLKKHSAKVNILSFLLAAVVTGVSYTILKKLSFFISINNLPTESAFNKAIPELTEIICDESDKTVQEAYNNLAPGAVVSIDTSWDHRRNGKHGITEAIDTNSGKIVAYKVLSKNGEWGEKYLGPPGNMEYDSLYFMVDNFIKAQIGGYVHDDDGKTRTFFNEKYKITEYLDANHASKAIIKRLKGYFIGTGRKYTGIKKSLFNWTNAILYDGSITQEKRRELWLNTPNHYSGDHSKCIHKIEDKEVFFQKNSEEYNFIQKFFNSTVEKVSKINPKYSTQRNEAFHSTKATYAPKSIAWRRSYKMRMCYAVGVWNDPNFIKKICKKIGKYTNEEDIPLLLQKYLGAKVKRQAIKKMKYFRDKNNKYRRKVLKEAINDFKKTTGYNLKKK